VARLYKVKGQTVRRKKQEGKPPASHTTKEENAMDKMILNPAWIKEIRPLVIWLTGVGLCAYVFNGSKRGGFSLGLDGLSYNYEK
jgi:hypothetical protein